MKLSDRAKCEEFQLWIHFLKNRKAPGFWNGLQIFNKHVATRAVWQSSVGPFPHSGC
jgi:hypothetical protein